MADQVPHQQVGSLCGTGEQEGKDMKPSPVSPHHPGTVECSRAAAPSLGPGVLLSAVLN